MASKQELSNLIKEWISCDNKIKQIQKITKETRAEKIINRIVSQCNER